MTLHRALVLTCGAWLVAACALTLARGDTSITAAAIAAASLVAGYKLGELLANRGGMRW